MEMAKLRDALHKKFLNSLIGKKMNVLIEKNSNNLIEGYSDNYIKVLIKGEYEKILENTIVKVEINNSDKDLLIGGIL
jgi:tRNA A37 methylthiotransferase MiaB